MRKNLFFILIVGILAASGSAFSASYYVVLTDGSWIPATGKPALEAGMVKIPLKSGLTAVIAEKYVDLEQSRSLSEKGEKPDGEHAMPGKGLGVHITITFAPPAGSSSGGSTPPAPQPAAAAPPPPPVSTTADQKASLRERIGTLDSGISELQRQKADLRQRISGSYDLDEAARLRKQMEGIDKDVQRLRDEKERLLVDLWRLQQP